MIETRIQHVEDIFGPVSGGCLVLRCGLYPVTLTVVEKDPKYFLTKFHWGLTHINSASVKYRTKADLDYHNPGDLNLPSEVWCYFMPMRKYQERNHGPPSDLVGMLLKPTGSFRGQYYRIGVLTVYLNEEDPDIMVSTAQGLDRVHESLYIEHQEGGFGFIEVA